MGVNAAMVARRVSRGSGAKPYNSIGNTLFEYRDKSSSRLKTTDEIIKIFVRKLNRPLSYSISIGDRSGKMMETRFQSNEIMLGIT